MANQPPTGATVQKKEIFFILIAGLFVFGAIITGIILTQNLDPERACIDEFKSVLFSAIEKNPDIIENMLTSPDTARKQIEAIAIAKPEIQTMLKSNQLWESRESLFSIAWDEVLNEIQPAEQ
ncbi:MAG: hypothetical protein P9L94_10645 [Candidatus Hinthialibacter antarcticus]|nr:hypothetical protein [Candidatus Hinthialibacter antarcticus]